MSLKGQSDTMEVFGSKEKIPFSLIGDVYYLPEQTIRLPKSFDVKKSVGKVYTNKLEIKPISFLTGFPGITDRYEWFAIDYHGYFAIDSARQYEFMLLSDDGSKLYVDEQLIVNNDGVHGPEGKRGKVFLDEGIHTINVQYFQGPRYQIALMLYYKTLQDEFYDVFNFEDFNPVNFTVNDSDDDIITLEISNSVLFAFDNYELKEEAKIVLNEIADEYLKNEHQGIVVEGHTDNVGAEEYNVALSIKRAASVKEFLISDESFDGRIWIKGYGESKPKNNNLNEQERSENRRVEIHIMDIEKIKTYLDSQ